MVICSISQQHPASLLHAELPLLQTPTESSKQPLALEPDPHAVPRSWHGLSGWKVGVLSCAITALVVLLLNLSVTVWASVKYGVSGGTSYLYTGSCERVASMSLWIHLGINVMSTLLLSASNCEYHGFGID